MQVIKHEGCLQIRSTDAHNFIKKCDLLRHPCVLDVLEKTSNDLVKLKIPAEFVFLHEMLDFSACSDLHAQTLLGQLGDALHHIHSRKIILKKISPENIGFCQTKFVFLDFSTSCFVGTKDVKYQLKRTLDLFMAPESLDYKMFSTKSDVFNLGLVAACIYGKNNKWREQNIQQLMAFTEELPLPDTVKRMLCAEHNSRPTALEVSQAFSTEALWTATDLLVEDSFQMTIDKCLIFSCFDELTVFHERVFGFIPVFLLHFTNCMTHLHGQFRHKVVASITSFLSLCDHMKKQNPTTNLFLFVEKQDMENLENFFVFCFGIDFLKTCILFEDCLQLAILEIDETFILNIFQNGTYEADIKLNVLKFVMKFCYKSSSVKLVSMIMAEVDNMQTVFSEQSSERNSLQEKISSLEQDKKRFRTENDDLRKENETLRTHMKKIKEFALQFNFGS